MGAFDTNAVPTILAANAAGIEADGERLFLREHFLPETTFSLTWRVSLVYLFPCIPCAFSLEEQVDAMLKGLEPVDFKVGSIA